MKQLTSIHTGSSLFLRFLPTAILVPSCIAGACLWGQRAGLYNLEFGTAILIISLIITFLALIWYNTVLLNRRDLQQRASEKYSAYLASLVKQTNDAVVAIDDQWEYVYVNQKAQKIFRLQHSDLQKKSVFELFPND